MPDLGVNEQAAVRRAQEKNAALLQRTMREFAERYVGSRGLTDTNRNRTYQGRMQDFYFAEVQGDDVIGFNNTARADFFEFGTQPHEIWASGLFEAGRRTPARGTRGQFTRGARALAFNFPSGDRFVGPVVDHPGQEPMPIMAWALEDATPEMADNLADELEREIARG
jgi:hypothetical protein